MDVVSLFSGCGGTDLGIEQGGYDIVWANDIDAWACASYKENMKLTPVCADIRKVPHFPKADLLVGCYPCQGFSLYGLRRKDDPRNFLYKEYARALGQTQPRYFLAENVKGLLSGYGRDIFKDMVANFKRKGYAVDWRLINAKDYGIPQDRERVFIVGVRKDLAKKYDFPEKTHGPGLKSYVTLRKAIGDLPAHCLNP
ncbi:DNA (cytosine-5-)-methyltransferase [Candidatus Micrarchaeota archaeon]|nr:DNA (cytosine-5-)-methyltransferase [Candidatus Micrarchaeota archaeon]